MAVGRYHIHGERSVGENIWHTGDDLKYFPEKSQIFDDSKTLASEFVFCNAHYLPKEPLFTPEDRFITVGSCFAAHIKKYFDNREITADTVLVPTGLNNSFAVRQWIEWALTGNRSTDAYWYSTAREHWEPNEEHKMALEDFKATKGFIFTFGLAEVWKDISTGGVFWRGIPEKIFDPSIHKCMVSSVGENLENLRKIYDLIKQHAGPDKVIIYTLSPIPLKATFLDRPAIVSDCVSKSVLRVALHEFFELRLPDVYYWPSFEMLRWAGAHCRERTVGHGDGPRDVDPERVKMIIDYFWDRFFK